MPALASAREFLELGNDTQVETAGAPDTNLAQFSPLIRPPTNAEKQ